MADALGFGSVFLTALVGGLAGLIMLATRVHDPRRVVTGAVEEAA
jgi:hypothetical protein